MTIAIVLVVSAVVAGVVAWLWWRGDGGLKPGSGERITAADVRLPDDAYGERATALLFTSLLDQRSTEVRDALRRLADEHQGVRVAEVDLAVHGDLAGRYAVTRTPSVFTLDAEQRLRARIKGAADADTVRRAVELALQPSPPA